MAEHYSIGTNVLRGTVSFHGGKRGRAYFVDDQGRAVIFVRAPVVQLTLTDTTLAPAWKSKLLTNAQGHFIGIEVAFGNAQVNQVVEWMASK